jgi:hypothetical protein
MLEVILGTGRIWFSFSVILYDEDLIIIAITLLLLLLLMMIMIILIAIINCG